MPIVRVQKHQHNYVIMDKQGLEDERLSIRARGLLAVLLAKPDGWEINLAYIAAHNPKEGREAIMKAMHELEACGYAAKQLQRDDTGKLRGYVTVVYETPDLAATEVGKTEVGKTEVGKTEVGKTEVGKTEVGKTAANKDTNTNKDPKTVNIQESNTPLPPSQGERTVSGRKSSRSVRQKGYSEAFCVFYEAYPRHEDPDDAWKAWQRIDGDAIASTIMAGLEKNRQLNDTWKRGYVKLPATFLNKGGYKSEFKTLPVAGGHDPEHFRQLLDAEGIPYEC